MTPPLSKRRKVPTIPWSPERASHRSPQSALPPRSAEDTARWLKENNIVLAEFSIPGGHREIDLEKIMRSTSSNRERSSGNVSASGPEPAMPIQEANGFVSTDDILHLKREAAERQRIRDKMRKNQDSLTRIKAVRLPAGAAAGTVVEEVNVTSSAPPETSTENNRVKRRGLPGPDPDAIRLGKNDENSSSPSESLLPVSYSDSSSSNASYASALADSSDRSLPSINSRPVATRMVLSRTILPSQQAVRKSIVSNNVASTAKPSFQWNDNVAEGDVHNDRLTLSVTHRHGLAVSDSVDQAGLVWVLTYGPSAESESADDVIDASSSQIPSTRFSLWLKCSPSRGRFSTTWNVSSSVTLSSISTVDGIEKRKLIDEVGVNLRSLRDRVLLATFDERVAPRQIAVECQITEKNSRSLVAKETVVYDGEIKFREGNTVPVNIDIIRCHSSLLGNLFVRARQGRRFSSGASGPPSDDSRIGISLDVACHSDTFRVILAILDPTTDFSVPICQLDSLLGLASDLDLPALRRECQWGIKLYLGNRLPVATALRISLKHKLTDIEEAIFSSLSSHQLQTLLHDHFQEQMIAGAISKSLAQRRLEEKNHLQQQIGPAPSATETPQFQSALPPSLPSSSRSCR